MALNWSKAEIDLTVSDYMNMLSIELHGQSYNKTAHRNSLLPLLNNRSNSSIERKHQNISAVLIDFGLPYIIGYKPLGNYQAQLAERVAYYLEERNEIITVVEESVDQPTPKVAISGILSRLVQPPSKKDYPFDQLRESASLYRPLFRTNYLEREAGNSSLGQAGELFVLEFEKARLAESGKGFLCDKVEHVSVTRGDGLGFDVKSYEINGTDRLIEVKTTAGGKHTPFFVSKNEIIISKERERAYHLYRVFGFRKDPRLFMVRGALDKICHLEATQYRAKFD